jgi:hypothetical protein
MRVDHIIVMLDLLLEDPLRSTALHLLYKSYTPEDSTYIWSIWELHVRLPRPTPSPNEGTLAMDLILAMLQMENSTPEHATGDAPML